MFKCLLDVGEDLDADALPGCARAWVSCVCVCVCVRACVGARVLARPAAAGRLVAAESRVRCATPQCARARCARVCRAPRSHIGRLVGAESWARARVCVRACACVCVCLCVCVHQGALQPLGGL